MKEGYKSTEFWLAISGIAGVVFGLDIPEDQTAYVVAGISGIYTVVRGWVKAAAAKK